MLPNLTHGDLIQSSENVRETAGFIFPHIVTEQVNVVDYCRYLWQSFPLIKTLSLQWQLEYFVAQRTMTIRLK